ncbi:hypothetical protein LIER_00990 [Lithospermum erythrorhizon]|uniref:Uncharacterized protein n=1 Tax=Lithospermum erythrorhizon TaxID=34254 RepID=A0AAV3NKU6_LITER
MDVDYKPIDVAHIFYDNNMLSEWLDHPGDVLLDKFDYEGGRRSNTFLATLTKRLSRSCDDANVTELDDGDSDDGEHGDDDPLLMGNRQQQYSQSIPFFVRSETLNVHEDRDRHVVEPTCEDNRPPTRHLNSEPSQYEPLIFTEDQYFDHATQDEDHGS